MEQGIVFNEQEKNAFFSELEVDLQLNSHKVLLVSKSDRYDCEVFLQYVSPFSIIKGGSIFIEINQLTLINFTFKNHAGDIVSLSITRRDDPVTQQLKSYKQVKKEIILKIYQDYLNHLMEQNIVQKISEQKKAFLVSSVLDFMLDPLRSIIADYYAEGNFETESEKIIMRKA